MPPTHINSTLRLNYNRHLSRLRCISLRGLAIERDYENPRLFAPEFDLELRAVNLFAGSNGSGKTTILDAVRSIFEPVMLARLRRENIAANVVSGLRAVFENGSYVWALFHQTGEPRDSLRKSPWDWQHTELSVHVVDEYDAQYYYSVKEGLPVIGSVDEEFLQPFRDSLSKLGCVGKAWPSVGATSPCIKDYESILRRFQRFFPHNEGEDTKDGPQLSAKPGDLRLMSGHLQQYHGDDLRQGSRLSLEYLPSGWQQVVELLSWVERCDDDSICVIDEPERHLHPTLQRALVSELSSLQRRKKLQLFIATHSSTFLNRRSWGSSNIALFHMSSGRPVAEPALDRIIEQLGCLASDICQSNGVIWVEGPSDRIYIKAFLRAWRAIRSPDRLPWIENVDYSFAFFDGSCLSHFAGTSSFDPPDDGDPAAELIELLSLNRNVAVCIDRDNDFGMDDFGSILPVNAFGTTKARVANELAESGSAVIHITDCYTMECYVSQEMPNGFLEVSQGHVKVAGNKVRQATRFARETDTVIHGCLTRHWGLGRFIEKLDAVIGKWGHSDGT